MVSKRRQFLEYCTRLIFLRRVGGGYAFIHSALIDYFAESNDPTVGLKKLLAEETAVPGLITSVALGAGEPCRCHAGDQLWLRQPHAAETAAIAEILGRLRAGHLSAHLETKALLSPEQIAMYSRLRGNDPTKPLEHRHHHG